MSKPNLKTIISFLQKLLRGNYVLLERKRTGLVNNNKFSSVISQVLEFGWIGNKIKLTSLNE